jgi:tetratricopeptide (TPR) repeat protein
MSRAPIGAVISYWLRPQRDRVHIHRIEVEHALYLAAATQEQIKDTLTLMLRRQSESLGRISQSLDDLRDEIAAGFSALSDGLAIVDDTLHRGFYQLHLDELGTHARLDDLLLLIYDKKGYQRELAARHSAAEAPRALYNASSEYFDAIVRTRQALNESNLAKAGAMLDEAVVLFRRASANPDFALDAHFQLGYLAQQHERNIEAAYEHYNKALGTDYSSHFVRAARHLAHLDYLTGQRTRALARMQELIAHDDAISTFAHDLQMANDQLWEDKACIRALKAALEAHGPLLARCARLSNVRRQFDDGRCFSATEGFRNSHSLIMEELRALRPEVRVYFDAARYAFGSVHSARVGSWIKHCYRAQPTLKARRAFLIESMADEDLRQVESRDIH